MSPSSDEQETNSVGDVKIKSISTSDEQEVKELAPPVLCDVKGTGVHPPALKPAIKNVIGIIFYISIFSAGACFSEHYC